MKKKSIEDLRLTNMTKYYWGILTIIILNIFYFNNERSQKTRYLYIYFFIIFFDIINVTIMYIQNFLFNRTKF